MRAKTSPVHAMCSECVRSQPSLCHLRHRALAGASVRIVKGSKVGRCAVGTTHHLPASAATEHPIAVRGTDASDLKEQITGTECPFDAASNADGLILMCRSRAAKSKPAKQPANPPRTGKQQRWQVAALLAEARFVSRKPTISAISSPDREMPSHMSKFDMGLKKSVYCKAPGRSLGLRFMRRDRNERTTQRTDTSVLDGT